MDNQNKDNQIEALYELIELELQMIHVCLEGIVLPYHIDTARRMTSNLKGNVIKLVELSKL